MTDNKYIQKTYEVRYVEQNEEDKLPTIEQIRTRKETGQPTLTEAEKEYIKTGDFSNQEIIVYALRGGGYGSYKPFSHQPIVHPASSSDRGKNKVASNSSGKVEWGNQHLIDTLNNKIGCDNHDWWDESDSAHTYNNGFEASRVATSAGFSGGVGGLITRGNAQYSAFEYQESDGRASFGNFQAGFEAGGGLGGITAGYTLRADIANIQTAGVQARVGLDGSSGFTVGPGGIETKVAGFGVSLGKKTGVSLPFGEVAVDFEELGDAIDENCVIQ